MLPSLLRFAPLAAVLTVGSSADSFRDRLGREFHRTGPPAVAHPSHGSIERLDRAFDDLVAPDAAMERLASIVSSGPRCGVYTLMAREENPAPDQRWRNSRAYRSQKGWQNFPLNPKVARYRYCLQ